MAFPPKQVAELLVQCHRRCCICHRFCGVKIETDHIKPLGDGRDDSIENAIPVCFECHAEIHSYNNDHPRGRKFTPEELRLHKEQWLKICAQRADILLAPSWRGDVGPLQALIDELEFNLKVASKPDTNDMGCKFHEEQLRRAIHEGSIAILRDEIREAVLEAYVLMDAANRLIETAWLQPPHIQGQCVNEAQKRLLSCKPKIDNAKEQLLRFLGREVMPGE